MHIFFDFDSTTITQESLDEVIAWKLKDHPDREKLITKIDQITNQGMGGSLPFTESVKQRFEVVELNVTDFETVGGNFVTAITPGMTDVFAKLQKKHQVFVISGGFLPSLYAVTDLLNVPRSQVLANGLVLNGSGEVLRADESSPMWSNKGKGAGIQALLLLNGLDPSAKTVLVGDGANDLNTYLNGQVDEFIGFGGNVARDNVRAKSQRFVMTVTELQREIERIAKKQ